MGEDLEIIFFLSFKGLQKWYILESIIFYLNSFSFISSPNPFFNLRVWRWNRMDIISTIKHFFHEFITFKYRKSYLWILNLRSYCLTLKTMPLFPWALLITAAMLLLTLPI